jgi:hypothetical protein
MRLNNHPTRISVRVRDGVAFIATTDNGRGTHTFRSALLAVRLHSDMSVKMIQGAISLFTTIPATLIHALDFSILSTGTLVLPDRDKGVNLRQRILLTISGSPKR